MRCGASLCRSHRGRKACRPSPGPCWEGRLPTRAGRPCAAVSQLVPRGPAPVSVLRAPSAPAPVCRTPGSPGVTREGASHRPPRAACRCLREMIDLSSSSLIAHSAVFYLLLTPSNKLCILGIVFFSSGISLFSTSNFVQLSYLSLNSPLLYLFYLFILLCCRLLNISVISIWKSLFTNYKICTICRSVDMGCFFPWLWISYSCLFVCLV